MTYLQNTLLQCCVFIFPTLEAAKNGIKAGGSGFAISMTCGCPKKGFYSYIISNKHVVRSVFHQSKMAVIRINGRDGEVAFFETKELDWVFHDDEDLAACLFREDHEKLDLAFLSYETIVKPGILEVEYLLGLDVFLIGRFQGLDESVKNYPVVRFGRLASNELIPIDVGEGRSQPSFLIEMRTISGFSGSPVIIEMHVTDKKGNVKPRKEYMLLGVHKGHIRHKAEVLKPTSQGNTGTPDGLFAYVNSGMACAVPAWKVLELLDHNKFKRPRDAHVAHEMSVVPAAT